MATQHQTVGQISRRMVSVPAHAQQADPTGISRFLDGIDFPQSKSDIVAYAYAHGCGSGVMRALEGLHERVYENLTELRADLAQVSAEPER
jgi:hypothetical protein